MLRGPDLRVRGVVRVLLQLPHLEWKLSLGTIKLCHEESLGYGRAVLSFADCAAAITQNYLLPPHPSVLLAGCAFELGLPVSPPCRRSGLLPPRPRPAHLDAAPRTPAAPPPSRLVNLLPQPPLLTLSERRGTTLKRITGVAREMLDGQRLGLCSLARECSI